VSGESSSEEVSFNTAAGYSLKTAKDIYRIKKEKALRENLESPMEFSTHKILPQIILTVCATTSRAARARIWAVPVIIAVSIACAVISVVTARAV
jgi:hypothetical protein